MRVLLVTAMVAGGVGGHVRMLARGLVEAGHRVVVASPSEVSESFQLASTGATVVPVEVGNRVRPVHDLQALRHLRRLAAGADVVHAHGMRGGALAALATLAGVGPPLVVTVHNAPPADRTAARVYGLLERIVHGRADLVLGVSPDLVDRARDQGARQVDLAVVPADLTAVVPRHRRAEVRAAVRRELGLVDGQLLLLTVGRLGAQKRTVEVVAAYQSLVERESGGTRAGPAGLAGGVLPSVVLAVVGDGPARVDMAAQAAARPGSVHLLGRRDDVPELLAAADVVVSGAQWEGQPLWLQEALGAGAPIVATDVGGTGVVVGDAAVLVRSSDGTGPNAAARVRALRDALEQVLVDADLRTTLSASAVRRAGELPTAAEATAAALAAYARVRGTAYPDRAVGPDVN